MSRLTPFLSSVQVRLASSHPGPTSTSVLTNHNLQCGEKTFVRSCALSSAPRPREVWPTSRLADSYQATNQVGYWIVIPS